jgi:hypothetical protein
VVMRGRGHRGVTGLAANFGRQPLEIGAAGCLSLDGHNAASDPGWIDRPARPGPALLAPLSAVILKEPQQ